jgi:hypothetical protein
VKNPVAGASNGQSLSYVYGHADPRDAGIAKALTLDERRIAANIAKLRHLLGNRSTCSRRTGAFHRLVQFITASHPSKVASLLVGGAPGRGDIGSRNTQAVEVGSGRAIGIS